jgi:hypothetical protein
VKINTIKLHADGNITCNIHWTIQCSRKLKYSIVDYKFVIIQKDDQLIFYPSVTTFLGYKRIQNRSILPYKYALQAPFFVLMIKSCSVLLRSSKCKLLEAVINDCFS